MKVRAKKKIPDGLTADHILRAMKDWDSGVRPDFGASIKHDLLHEGKRYPPKAIIGLAFKYLTGSILDSGDFCNGNQKGQANFVLRNLNFEIVDKA